MHYKSKPNKKNIFIAHEKILALDPNLVLDKQTPRKGFRKFLLESRKIVF